MFGEVQKSIALPAFFKQSTYDSDELINIINQIQCEGFFDTIEFFYDGDAAAHKRLADHLKTTKLNSIFLAAFPMKMKKLDIADPSKEERILAIDQVKAWIKKAYTYRSKKMMIISGPEVLEPKERADALMRLTESIIEICNTAKNYSTDYTLDITLEFFNHRGEPYFLLGPTERVQKVYREVHTECDNFELTFDLSHSLQLGENPKTSIQRLHRGVHHIHLANCVIQNAASPFYGDKHPPFGWAGGEVNEEGLYTFMKDIQAIEYYRSNLDQLTIGVEIITPAQEDEYRIYKDATRIFRETINRFTEEGE